MEEPANIFWCEQIGNQEKWENGFSGQLEEAVVVTAGDYRKPYLSILIEKLIAYPLCNLIIQSWYRINEMSNHLFKFNNRIIDPFVVCMYVWRCDACH